MWDVRVTAGDERRVLKQVGLRRGALRCHSGRDPSKAPRGGCKVGGMDFVVYYQG